jgi:hypothetical protein
MMDVADWLHDSGLGQYTAAFTENSVSMDLLPTLTADDLKDLGINVVGIGKSRLIAQLEQCLASKSHASLRYFCCGPSYPSRRGKITAMRLNRLSLLADPGICGWWPVPASKPGQVPIRVAATSVNPVDLRIVEMADFSHSPR